MVTAIGTRTLVRPRVGNVSGEADAAFLSELKRKDRPRYDRLIDSIKMQAYKSQRAKEVGL
jgi:hypothetical protein